MKIAVMQPYFFPYYGYFNLLKKVDHCIFLDNVQFNRRGWVHRNRLYNSNNELKWLTLPLIKKNRIGTLISDLEFSPQGIWKFQEQKNKFPILNNKNFNGDLINLIFDLNKNVLNYLTDTILYISKLLEIRFSWDLASKISYTKSENYQENTLNIVKSLKGTQYLNLPGGKNLYNTNYFLKNGIDIKFLEEDPRKESILEYL